MKAKLKIQTHGCWFIKCQKCGELHASASERMLLPEWSDCDCDKELTCPICEVANDISEWKDHEEFDYKICPNCNEKFEGDELKY